MAALEAICDLVSKESAHGKAHRLVGPRWWLRNAVKARTIADHGNSRQAYSAAFYAVGKGIEAREETGTISRLTRPWPRPETPPSVAEVPVPAWSELERLRVRL